MKQKFFSLKWLGLLILAGGLVACGDNSPAVSSTTTSATTAPATTANVTTAPASATTVAATTTAPATTTIPATTALVVTTAAGTSTQATTNASTTAPASSQTDEAARGLAIFKQQGCAGCHGGDKAVGALGPALNNINFPEAGLLRQVRSGAAPMPAFSPSKLPDSDVHLIYVYLTSLKNQK